MDLGSVFSRVSQGLGKNNEKKEVFLALKISPNKLIATSWSTLAGKVEIGQVGESRINLDGEIKDVLESADVAISKALDGHDMGLVKTIFGVPPDWIVEGKIIETRIAILKRLCRELDLKPLGYVLLSEALENYLKEKEGAPLTAILVGMEGTSGWITIYRAGKNLGTVPIAQGDFSPTSAPLEIDRALKRFADVEVLPARMILYDGQQDLDALSEKITAYPWTKQLPFLHVPKVEVLPAELVVKAIAVAGGTQMGAHFDLSSEEPEEDKTPTLKPPAEGTEPEPEPAKEIPPKEITEGLEEVDAGEAGFSFDTTAERTLGTLQELKADVTQAVASEEKQMVRLGGQLGLNKIISQIGSHLKSLKRPQLAMNKPEFLKSRPKNMRLVFLGLVILVAFFGVLGTLLYLVPKATVIVHLTPNIFDREMEATISGEVVSATEIGTKKGVATGKKMVGDKATGTVVLYSATSGKTFAAGTALTSSDGLRFTLDQEITVASASDFLSPATVTAKVTAGDIGDKYNLPGNTRFSVAGVAATSYLAKNDSAFTGGSSHEATVVTAGDQNRLLATLSAELTERAKTDLDTKLTANQTILPNAITSEVAKKKFSKDVDAEADTISLDLTMDFKGVVVSQEELLQRFMQNFASDVPADYEPLAASLKVEIKSAKIDKSGNALMTVHLTVKLLPKFDKETVIKDIAGRSVVTAENKLRNLSGVSGVEFSAKPRLFSGLFNYFLPWRQANIQLDLVSD